MSINEQPTLEQVRQAFKTWRDTRTYGREKTPLHLWELVRAIALFYPRRKIEIALSITKEQLDREAPVKEFGKPTYEPQEYPEPNFVELSISELKTAQRLASPLMSGMALTITRGDGSSWAIAEARQDIVTESLRLFLRG